MQHLTTLRASILMVAIAATGCATQGAPVAKADTPATPAAPAKSLPPELCLQSTGSLLPPPKAGCLSGRGHVYTVNEIEQANHPLMGDTLRWLMP